MADIIEPRRGTICREKGIRSALFSPGAGFDKGSCGGQNIYLNGLLLEMKETEIGACYHGIIDLADSSGMRSRLGFAIAFHVMLMGFSSMKF